MQVVFHVALDGHLIWDKNVDLGSGLEMVLSFSYVTAILMIKYKLESLSFFFFSVSDYFLIAKYELRLKLLVHRVFQRNRVFSTSERNPTIFYLIFFLSHANVVRCMFVILMVN